MTSTPIIIATADEIGTRVAGQIADGLRAAAAQGKDYLLGCPTGRTPAPVFPALATLAADGLDVSRLVIVLMDEYVLPRDDGFRAVSPEHSYSCVGYARRQILEPLEAAGGASPPSSGTPTRPNRQPTTGGSRRPAASTCSCSLPAPATAMSRSIRPDRHATP